MDIKQRKLAIKPFSKQSGKNVTSTPKHKSVSNRRARVLVKRSLGKSFIALAALWAPLVGVAAPVTTPWHQNTEPTEQFSSLDNRVARMQEAQAYYETIIEQGGWKPLDAGELLAEGALRKGDTSQAVSLLITRLAKEYPALHTLCDDRSVLSPSLRHCTFDELIEDAVKDFQQRHGLDVDGVVGKNTLAALNITAEQKRQQLALNIARLTAFEANDEDAYVLVNIPEFRLRYINDGQVKAKKDVVVGKPSWATPSFSDEIEKFVVNPEWRIPLSIATREIAPKVAEDPDYLEKNNIVIRKNSFIDDELVDPSTIDWASVKPYQFDHFLVKLPHDKNPLGKVKYLFPNPHAVYVHDTPYQQWFNEPVRAASHGCIRLEDPFSLAKLIAEEQGVESLLDNVISARDLRESKTFHLKEPLPIHLVYWTAWADENGRINFRNDIYRRDARDTQSLSQLASL